MQPPAQGRPAPCLVSKTELWLHVSTLLTLNRKGLVWGALGSGPRLEGSVRDQSSWVGREGKQS